MKKCIFLFVATIFSASVSASDLKNGYYRSGFVVCNDGQEYFFKQDCGFLKCDPDDAEKQQAHDLCERKHGGVNRGDEGFFQRAERGNNSMYIGDALRIEKSQEEQQKAEADKKQQDEAPKKEEGEDKEKNETNQNNG